MVSEMSGRRMKYTITIEGKAAAAAPKPTGKPRGRPPKDPAKKAAEAEQKKKDDHKKAISEFDKVYDERQKYLDAGIGDEFAGWQRRTFAPVKLVLSSSRHEDKLASCKFAPDRLAPLRLALSKRARLASTPARLAPLRSAELNSAPFAWTLAKLQPRRSVSANLAPVASTPAKLQPRRFQPVRSM